ncbi:MAG: metallophosphoesterase [Saprospiraceae bacterium]|nr:metallophosphoesterase [Saprospiraceae bacterium]
MRSKYTQTLFVLLLLLTGCATFKTANVARQPAALNIDPNEVSLFLIGDSGKPEEGNTPSAMLSMQKKFDLADENDILLFLGDNVYQKGIPDKDHPQYAAAKLAMDVQLDVAKNFPGKAYFIPGNHDWYSGLKGLKRQEKMVEDVLGKGSYLPQNGCPLDLIDVNDDLAIITVDSHWYVANWDRHPTINNDCGEINSREKFLSEFSGLVNKQQNKTLIIALHHPLFTNGQHDAQFPANALFLGNFLRKTTGVVNADLQHPLYRQLANRISTIIENQQNDVIVVSGHEHNLQFLERNHVKQIVSGSGSKETQLKVKGNDFGFAGKGFAILQIHSDAQTLSFFDKKGEKVHSRTLSRFEKNQPDYSNAQLSGTTSTAIYSDELFAKMPNGGGMNGERYRKYYGMDFEFPVADLSTLYGGLSPVKMGGGFQSVSLRLEDKDGKEYAMRRVRKSASQFIQKELFRENYVQDEIRGSFPEAFIFDFYTTAYPFAFLTIGDLADAVEVYHTNPKVYYIPKQPALGKFNEFVGDDLYLIEERPAKEWKALESFGRPDNIKSTDDVIQRILGDEDNRIDQAHFIRTRLFDMWLSDWDRHSDQFRWAVYEDGNKQVYRAIPRDRDQAFPKYDGTILRIGTAIVPELRKMQTIGHDIKSLKYLNVGNYKFDLALLQATSLEDWQEAANFLANNLTDEVIEEAFENLPQRAQDATAEDIKSKLKSRRKHLNKWANEYYDLLSKRVVITATNKDDFIDVHRNENKEVEVKIFRNKGGERKELYVDAVFSPSTTKQVWIYGLNEEDTFTVTGGRSPIKLFLVGGAKSDTYDINKKSKVRIFDFASKNNEFLNKSPKRNITNDYEANNFDVYKFQHNNWTTLPSLTFDPDGGFQPGFLTSHNVNRFTRNGFSAQHSFGANYFSATEGISAFYSGHFKDVIKRWAVELNANYATPSYAENFFGYGNNTVFDDAIDFEFYRVRQRQIQFQPALVREWTPFGRFSLSFPVERISIEDNANRLVENYFGNDEQLGDNTFYGAEVNYAFENSDNNSNPSLGVQFDVRAGFKRNNDNDDFNFFYIRPQASFQHPIIGDRLVAATKLNGVFQQANDIVPFYYGAAFGGNEGLRGFRNERFTGESGFYQSSDLRLKVADVSTFLLPGTIGLFGGYDYGKVWLNGDQAQTFIGAADFVSDFQDSFGGGFYWNGANLFTLKSSFFSSDDGGRFVAGLGFDF